VKAHKPSFFIISTCSLLCVAATAVDAKLISRSAGATNAGGDFGDRLIIINSALVESGQIPTALLDTVAELDGFLNLKNGSAASGLCDAPTSDYDPAEDDYQCGYEFFQNEVVELIGNTPSFGSNFIDASYVWTISNSAGSIQNVFDPSLGGSPNQTAFSELSDFAFLQPGSFTVTFDIKLTINALGLGEGYDTFGDSKLDFAGWTDPCQGIDVIPGDPTPVCVPSYDVNVRASEFNYSTSTFLNIVSRPVSAPTGITLMLLGGLGIWITRRKLKTN
jgi:hypothetical protein